MTKKILLAFILVMIYAGCSYSVTSITDVSGLNAIRNSLSGDYRLDADIQLSAYTTWLPIDNFTGTFDGNGHTIYIRIAAFDDTDERLLAYDRALFGNISGGTISNLQVTGTAKGYNSAGIAARLSSGSITNCTFSGDVEVWDVLGDYLSEHGKINAGGIVARMTGGSIQNCSFSGNVKATSETENLYANAGGIVARMTGGNISGCYSGKESVMSAGGDGAASGGIVAYAVIELDDEISDCKFDGLASSDYSAGGIVGTLNGGIVRNNEVLSNSRINGNYRAGGISGIIQAASTIKSNKANSGAQVTAAVRSAGGIIGYLGEGETPTVDGNISRASVSGDALYKGGIIGEIHNHAGASSQVTDNSYSTALYGVGIDEYGQTNINLPGTIAINSGNSDLDNTETSGDISSLSITTSQYLPNARVNENYSQTLETNAGEEITVTWSESTDILQDLGLTLSSDGTITGVPVVSGNFTFTIVANFSSGTNYAKTFSLTVNSISAVPIITASLSSGKVGEEYLAEIRTTLDGVTWSVYSGNLPDGITLSTSGLLSGTPTEAGTFTFIVRAATNTREGLRRLTLLIEPSNNNNETSKDIEVHYQSSGGGGCNSSCLGIILLMLIFKRLC